MTIAVAIRTGSAVVFAADSKLTTSGLAGFEQDGTPRWVKQTYDGATKVVHDRDCNIMVMVAGHANVGDVGATDFVSTLNFPYYGGSASTDQDDGLQALLIDPMVSRKRARWEATQIPPDQWPGPTMLLAASSSDGLTPRVWLAELSGEGFQLSEPFTGPGIRLEGSFLDAFTLLYGYSPSVLEEVATLLDVEPARVGCALRSLRVLQPITKLNLDAMPVQDAIDLAVFLANVQVEMDRFLPGTPACGGPIDVMVLQMAPKPGIVAYPGKALHHPQDHRYNAGR